MRVLFNVAGGYGHLYPIVSLARALESRGNEVAVAVPEYFAAAVEKVGLEPLPLMAVGVSAASESFKEEQARRLPIERARATISRFLKQAVLQTAALRDATTEWGANVLVRESAAFASWLVGDLLRLPVATLDVAPAPSRLTARLLGDLFRDARKSVDLPPDNDVHALNRWLHLLPAPPEWFSADFMGPTTHVFQPPEDPLSEAPPDFLREMGRSRPFVYVTLGTKFNDTPGVFESIIDALGGEAVDALVTVGPNRNPNSFHRVPRYVRIERFVPQATALAKADAVVCHGGYGAVMGALRHGLPLVTIPLAGADQLANAGRIEATGAGVTISEGDRSAIAIRAGIRAILKESTYRDAARKIRDSIAILPPLTDAAELIERLGEERRPITR